MTSILENITVSPCGTHHLKNGQPLYSKRFVRVLKYHVPGVAPVVDHTGAYHIDILGNPLYGERFQQTFGFYDGYAAVESNDGWFHIKLDGTSLYKERYSWCGNFQEKKCPVSCNPVYFHINTDGTPLYPEQYAYVGDFKDGIAVVTCRDTGLHTHIDTRGNFIHLRWFFKADVFHKNYAPAKDARGWAHVDKNGDFIYTQRYASIEPFYNGLSYVETFSGHLLVINEQGETIRFVRQSPLKDERDNLSSDMVGFWKTWTIATAVTLKIPDLLPNSLEKIAQETGSSVQNLQRLLKGLWELGLTEPLANNRWKLTEKGKFLSPTQSAFLASAAQMWTQVNKAWEKLPHLIQQPESTYHPSFKELETNKVWANIYNKALDGYSLKDLTPLSFLPCWKNHDSILGFGRTSVSFIKTLLKKYPHLKGEALETPLLSKDRFYPSKVDAMVCPRFLHYFPDNMVCHILQKMIKSLDNRGILYIMEMLLDDKSPAGGLFDLNMFVETGGKVRTLKEWELIFSFCGLKLESVNHVSLSLSVLKVKKA
jgi:hypothetical protein